MTRKSKELQVLILELHSLGRTKKQVLDALGIHETRVSQVAPGLRWPGRNTDFAARRQAAIARLQAGETTTVVAQSLGYASRASLNTIMHNRGFSLNELRGVVMYEVPKEKKKLWEKLRWANKIGADEAAKALGLRPKRRDGT